MKKISLLTLALLSVLLIGCGESNDVVNDFNEDIYGNMNEAQKAKIKALQDAGQIPSDLSAVPAPPSNPEDWEPNEDGLDDTNECAGAFCE